MFALSLRTAACRVAVFCLALAAVLTSPPATAEVSVGLLDAAWSFPAAAAAIELRYTTANRYGQAAPASAGLYLPPGLPPAGGWPLVVWAHGTVGVADGCAPSHHPQSERNRGYFGEILGSGYAVLAPDYQGLGTGGGFSYYNTLVEGRSILDAVAAVRTTPVPLSRNWVVIGQSEGSHAALSAVSLYDPTGPAAGLNGAVVTGLRANTGPSLREMFRSSSTGSANQIAYAAYFLTALQQLHPDRVTPFLSDFGRDYVAQANSTCLADLTAAAAGRRPAALVADPDSPTPTFEADIAELTDLRTEQLPIDIAIGYGTADIDVAPTWTEQFGDHLRTANPDIQVTVTRYPGKDHSGAFLASLPDTLGFLRSHL
ncbi:alpha/beta hydrolase family protein [Nocardia acidivorans]|uniref:alpha/beta hydrolase family protein n=1 Tax=Nocardia acidivorans TaxID=404580 RepID=UPI00082FF6DF|nr:lipase family protein [Nocardia acidivorans]